tara:strand:+ start:11250 stop:11621 length:372 start_codon:yes stop_codon:yes gene_type:complete
MIFIPSDKFDIQACKQLEVTPQDEVRPFIPDLLVWLQDFNWPVAPFVKQKLIQFDKELIIPLKFILSGDDVVWKYVVLTELIPEVKSNVINSLQLELKRIGYSPSEEEISEEVDKHAIKYIRT